MRQADRKTVSIVSSILTEAAVWLTESGKPMWRADACGEGNLLPDVGSFFIAYLGDQPAGVLRFQTEDTTFWPELSDDRSAFIHKLAVRRCFTGQGVSTAMLLWAADRARSLGKRFLRMDCDAARPRLRKFYEDFGFTHHSDKQVGPYLVARYEYETGGI